MKKTIQSIFRKSFALILLVFSPSLVLASTTGGGAIAGQLQITTILQQIIDFLTSEFAVLLIILGFVVGAGMIAVARQNDAAGWQRIGKVIIGGTIGLAAVGLANLFFAGAVI